MGKSSIHSPVSTTDGGNVELGRGNGTTNGGGNFGRALDSKTNMSISIFNGNGNESLETSALTG
eukprot:CAMPEP_0194449876 /NCGR_PEP_ID=MMETSP0176-20130528/130401_1 /TAXON_ID=216777 /ORGANISM="Proboscia alata, Strain PI-D3" /LENGTH=63 /DNA_ID=CAMNT_0039277075 /DNA_START=719 /DNA_END=910 /DNA_ORIENTATION=-